MEPKTAKEVHEVLYDGADIQVSLRDGSTRTVKVRKISRRDYSAFAACFGDEEAEAEHYLGGQVAVADLSDESFDAVMQEGHRLNFTRFSNWFARQYQRLNVIGQSGAMKTALEMIDQVPALKTLVGSMNGSSR